MNAKWQAGASPFTIALGFAAIYLIWGSTYLAIRFMVETIPPFYGAAVRFLIGGVALYGWARIRGAEKPSLRQWGAMAIIGALLLMGGNGLVTWAEKIVPSGLTALLIGMVPLWLVLFDWLSPGGARPKWVVILGLALGFAGVGALVDPTNVSGVEEIDFFGAVVIGLATILWAIGSIYSRHADTPDSKILAVGMQMLTGAVALSLFGALVGETAQVDISAVSMKSVWALVYLITAGSVGYAAYIWLLQVTTPAKVSTYAYVNPVIALFLGNLLAGETLSAWTLGCSAVIIGAVFLIITNKSKSPAANTPNSPEAVCTAADDVCLSGEAALACETEVKKV